MTVDKTHLEEKYTSDRETSSLLVLSEMMLSGNDLERSWSFGSKQDPLVMLPGSNMLLE
jgi:hypothetical protein